MDTVPKQEIERRTERFQSVLSRQGLDGAFLLQNVDIYYFAGTIQTSVLFMPAEGEPILMVQKGAERARSESPLNALVSIDGRADIPKTLRQFGVGEVKRAGLEMDVLPTAFYLWFKEVFPHCRWADLSEAIRKVRMVKTPYEVRQIREAAEILHRGYTEIGQIIREGMTKLEIDEFPLIAPGFSGALADGMVIALEPKFVFPGRGVVGLEDDYLVTASGVERLTRTEQVLMKIET